MGKLQEKIGIFSYLKDISSFSRDAILTIIIAICIINPSSIKSFLKESGLSKLGIFGVTVELQEEKEKIEIAQNTISAKVLVPEFTVKDEAPLEALNRPVDQDFKQAILSAQRVAPQILPTAGWVFLGLVDNKKTQWTNNVSSTTNANWPVKPDDILTVRDDVYIRAITNDKWHSSAPVTTVSKVGDKLKVVELDFSSAKIGGFYVWAKVAIQ